MDGLELKTKFDGLQELFNRCINHAFRVLTDRITAKSAYLDCEQMRELEKLEYIRTADELAQLFCVIPYCPTSGISTPILRSSGTALSSRS